MAGEHICTNIPTATRIIESFKKSGLNCTPSSPTAAPAARGTRTGRPFGLHVSLARSGNLLPFRGCLSLAAMLIRGCRSLPLKFCINLLFAPHPFTSSEALQCTCALIIQVNYRVESLRQLSLAHEFGLVLSPCCGALAHIPRRHGFKPSHDPTVAMHVCIDARIPP